MSDESRPSIWHADSYEEELSLYIRVKDDKRIMSFPLIDQIAIINISHKKGHHHITKELLKILWRSVREFKNKIDQKESELFSGQDIPGVTDIDDLLKKYREELLATSNHGRFNSYGIVAEIKTVYRNIGDLTMRGLFRYLYDFVYSDFWTPKGAEPSWTLLLDRQPFEVEEIYTYLKFKYIRVNNKISISSPDVIPMYVKDLGLGLRESYSTLDYDEESDDEESDGEESDEEESDEEESDEEFRITRDTDYMVSYVHDISLQALSCLNVFEAMVKIFGDVVDNHAISHAIFGYITKSDEVFEFIRGVIMGRVIKYGDVDKNLYEKLYEAEDKSDMEALREIVNVLANTGTSGIGDYRVDWREAFRRRVLGEVRE